MRKTTQEDKALLDALAPIITKLIDDNFENSKDKIALQISPMIAPAIREQIKSQKSSIVEALYPILGSMISKFVSKSLEETLNSINNQIQSGLSFKSIKRKIQASRQGVSETQLLLEENAHSNIKAVLLIHKESGSLLAQAQNPNEDITEPEMIASMMTAINSFINDWIEKNESSSEVAEIDYGSSKIVVENAGYAYLAVIIDGAVYNRTLDSIRLTLEDIIKTHSHEIRNFNGDLSVFEDKAIEKKMAILIKENQKEEEKKKVHFLMYLIPLCLVALLVWKIYDDHLVDTLETKIHNAVYKTPLLTTFRIQTHIEDGTIYLNGEVPSQYHKSLALQKVHSFATTQKIQNNLIVVSQNDDPMQISSNIAYLLQGLNLQEGVYLKYKLEYPSLTILGSVWDRQREKKVLKALQNIKGVQTLHNEIKVIPPKMQTALFFKKGISRVTLEQEKTLLELSKTLKSLDNTLIVSFKGFSDGQGSLAGQKYIANKRAKNVADILKNKFFITQEVKISAPDNIHDYIEINKNSEERCCIITIENQEK